jgi:hypothetical protein
MEKRLLQALGETRHGRLLKQGAHRQIDAEGLAHPRHHLGRQERLPADLEEVVVDADRGELQHLGPDPGERLLDRIARRHPALSRGALPRVHPGQGAAVELAVRGERHLLVPDEKGWDHGLGKPSSSRAGSCATSSATTRTRPPEQRGEHLPDRNVEALRGGLRHHVASSQPERRDLGQQMVQQAPLLDRRPLGHRSSPR